MLGARTTLAMWAAERRPVDPDCALALMFEPRFYRAEIRSFID